MSMVAQLEQQKRDTLKLIELRDMAVKLSSNREFKKLIREEFMVNEAARYVQISADPALPANERADALAMAQSTGHLKRWLSVTIRMGNTAEAQLEDLDNAIAEARAEADLELQGPEPEAPVTETEGGLA